jgi:hypothetical protein
MLWCTYFFVRVGLIYGADATCVQDGGEMLIEEHLYGAVYDQRRL